MRQRGSISLMVLLMGVVSGVMVGGLVMLAGNQFLYSNRTVGREEALAIAEAGLQYYRWHLAHNPVDYTDAGGPVHQITDPQGGVLGSYQLSITPPPPGSTTVTVTSTGWTSEFPLIKRTVRARFAKPSLARFAFLHDANVWFGSGLTIHGRVMSNGGIRQDGINDSLIQSYQQFYQCGTETGCSPTASKSGVWGAGGPSTLWQFPAPKVDFTAISANFREMHDVATMSGSNLPPSGAGGYHIVFNANGTASIYRVNTLNYYKGYDPDQPSGQRCVNLYQRITNQTLVATYDLSQKPMIFSEDTVFVEGTVNGKVELAAAKFPIDTNSVDIWILNSIKYAAKDGNHSLGLIAQRNIYYAKDVPNDFEVNGALLAQKGKVMRHNYANGSCQVYSNAVRTKLTMYGALISGLKSFWNFGSPPVSGFTTRDVTYDPRLYLTPPPYFPYNINGDYEVISWTETANP